MKRQRTITGLAALVAAAALASPAQAAPHDPHANRGTAPAATRAGTSSLVNSGWQYFFWGPGSTAGPSFTFTTRTALRLTITDVFCRGDAFTVVSDGKVLAVTPTVPLPEGDYCEVSDPDVALHDPSYSSTSVIIKPGTYTITVEATVNPYEYGAGFLRLDFPPRPLG